MEVRGQIMKKTDFVPKIQHTDFIQIVAKIMQPCHVYFVCNCELCFVTFGYDEVPGLLNGPLLLLCSKTNTFFQMKNNT